MRELQFSNGLQNTYEGLKRLIFANKRKNKTKFVEHL